MGARIAVRRPEDRLLDERSSSGAGVSGEAIGAPRTEVALRLYVAGDSGPSARAQRQVEALRERLGGEGWEVEVVDVYDRPELAEDDRILATPVLIRLRPEPRLSVIGDLGDWRAVAEILDLERLGA